MTETELRNLLAKREGEGIECKPNLLSRREIAEYAVGIGNAGGGWLIMGVTDRVPRRVIPQPVPPDDEIARTRESVADSAQIHIEIEAVPTRDGLALVCRIPSRPRGMPFHTRDGKYLIRLGEGLRGMTLAELDAIRREAGGELTAATVPGTLADLISPSGMEELRGLMAEVGAPPELVKQTDRDLLRSLDMIGSDGRLRVAGLLLAGKPEAIHAHVPYAQWQFFRMRSDTEYDLSERGLDCFPVALKRLRQLVAANNPIVTIPGWLVHPEFPRYPAVALRELLVNALVHRDCSLTGAVTLKLYPDRLELSNPGGFVGGVTPENILHHPSTPRYPMLFQALIRMRLANASNLGVPRAFRDLLSEGKEPPIYWNSAQAVRVTVTGQDARREFLELTQRYPDMDTVAILCQRPIEVAREVLGRLTTRWKLLEAGGGAGRGRYYRLSRTAYRLLLNALAYHVDRRLGLEHAKARVLAALAHQPLSNADVREVTQMARHQALLLMKTLEKEGVVFLEGRGRGSYWKLRPKPDKC